MRWLWLSLGRWRITQACRARAESRWALVVVGLGPVEERCIGRGLLSSLLSTQPWCDVSAAGSIAKPAAMCAASAHVPALAVSGGSAALELSAHSPRRACCGLLRPHRRVLHRRGFLSFDARPRCDVSAVASNSKPAAALEASARCCFSLSLGGGRSPRASCSRAPRRVGCGRLRY